MTGRVFLGLAGRGILAGAAMAGANIPRSSPRLLNPVSADGSRDLTLSPHERTTIAALQNHLLPSEPGIPGARDIGALNYLENALRGTGIDPSDLPQLRKGVAALDNQSVQRTGKIFYLLPAEKKERILRKFERTDFGNIFLAIVMGYTIEAYVGDPVYGGNPDGIVWTWLGHIPGSPRPPSIPSGVWR